MERRYGFGSEEGRYNGAKKAKLRRMECVLLTSALCVILFCGLWILFHTAIKDARHLGSRRAGTEYHPTMQKNEHLTSNTCSRICTTEDCLKTAAAMVSSMDSRIDPCEDFYTFSCGKYDKESMDEIRNAQFMTEVSEQVFHVVADIIEKIPKNLPDNLPGHSASKARNFYDSCVNFDSTEKMAIPTALEYLEYFGVKNWPYLDSNYKFVDPDLDEVLFRLMLYSANPVFSLNLPGNEENVFQTDTTENSISESTLEVKADPTRRKLLLARMFGEEQVISGMTDILNYFGLSDETVNSTIQDALRIDEALEDIKQVSRKRIMDCSSNPSVNCSDYQFDCSAESNVEMEKWCTIMTKVMDAVGMRERYQRFQIVLQDKFFFEDILAFFANLVNHRSIACGIALEFFLEHSMTMNYHFRRTAVIRIIPKEAIDRMQKDRNLFCANWVLVHLPILVGAAFYSAKYEGRLQKEGDDINYEIQDHVISLVKNMTWIDPEVQDSLKRRMESVNLTIHYHLPHVSNASDVDEFYKRLHVGEQSFLSNMLELAKFSTVLEFFHHDDRQMVNKIRRNYFDLNPRYESEFIYIDFSSYVFPLLSPNRPRYSNMGTFGYFLSHEYGHGVEEFLRNPENLSPSFENVLNEKKRCLIDQYSQYELDLGDRKVKVNGSFTLNENTADFLAIRSAYEVMKSYQEKHGVEKMFPGLPFNVDQLFFISVAQSLCETNTLETLKTYLQDKHSPNKYRILGMMRNFEHFAEAFNCSLGSPMNPVAKCTY